MTLLASYAMIVALRGSLNYISDDSQALCQPRADQGTTDCESESRSQFTRDTPLSVVVLTRDRGSFFPFLKDPSGNKIITLHTRTDNCREALDLINQRHLTNCREGNYATAILIHAIVLSADNCVGAVIDECLCDSFL